MNLLACSDCGRRFYTWGNGPAEERCCPRCGGSLALSLYRVRSIPLDARWLDAPMESGRRMRLPVAEGPAIPSKWL